MTDTSLITKIPIHYQRMELCTIAVEAEDKDWLWSLGLKKWTLVPGRSLQQAQRASMKPILALVLAKPHLLQDAYARAFLWRERPRRSFLLHKCIGLSLVWRYNNRPLPSTIDELALHMDSIKVHFRDQSSLNLKHTNLIVPRPDMPLVDINEDAELVSLAQSKMGLSPTEARALGIDKVRDLLSRLKETPHEP